MPGARTTRSNGIVLFTLLIGTFIAGSAELLVIGLLPMVATGLDVSTASAGALVSANALGLALGGPLITAVTMRFDRRTVLIATMVGLGVLVASPAAIPLYGWFLFARLIGGALQGAFMAAAFSSAGSIVPADRSGRAVGIVIAGFSVATVVGLPLGVMAGSALGWRGTLLVTGGLALAVSLVLVFVAPSIAPTGESGGTAVRHVLSGRVVMALIVSFVLFAAPGAVSTYLIPLMHDVIGVSPHLTGVVLACYGAGSVVGTLIGGRLADAGSARSLIISGAGICGILIILYVARGSTPVAIGLLILWGVFTGSTPPSVQHRVVSLAGPGGALAASLPASAANAGIAVGTGISGIAYARSGPTAVILTGVAIAAVAFALAVATRRLQPPTPESDATAAHGSTDGTDDPDAADRNAIARSSGSRS